MHSSFFLLNILIIFSHFFLIKTIAFTFPALKHSRCPQTMVHQEPTSAATGENGIGGNASFSWKNYHPKHLLDNASSSLSQMAIIKSNNFSFQELSRYMDQRAAQQQRQFGELTRFVGSQIKQRVTTFTRKSEYQVGDITREVVRRIWQREYDTEDVLLTLKVLLAFGIALTPIASLLPIDVLIQMMNMSLAQQVSQQIGERLLSATMEEQVLVQMANLGLVQPIGAKVLNTITKEIDERLKLALTGDKNYRLDEETKAQLMASVSTFTGRAQYQVGDMSRRITELINQKEIRELKLGEAFRGLKLWDAEVVEEHRRAQDDAVHSSLAWPYGGQIFEE